MVMRRTIRTHESEIFCCREALSNQVRRIFACLWQIGVDGDFQVRSAKPKLVCPPLTSVIPNAVGIGDEAAVLLDRLIAGDAPPPHPILVPPLGVITRRSSDVLALEDQRPPRITVPSRKCLSQCHG
jgi:hypothetical protein